MIVIRNSMIFAAGVLLLLLSACTEIPPLVTPVIPTDPCENPDPERVRDQGRQVLIEEFTGVQCVNCPAGSEAIEDLLDLYGERLVVVSVHTGFFADPYPESNYDFRTPEGDQLATLLGSPLGYPTAVVNRKKFSGENRLQLGRNKWAGYIADELQQPKIARIDISAELDRETLELSSSVAVFFDESPANPLKLSLFLTETGVADLQKTPDGIDPEYPHRHVFRDAIGPYSGIEIMADQTYCSEFRFEINPEWNVERLYLVAILSESDDSLEVLQAHQEKIIP